ncbi:MAG: hypothetical protein K2M01_07465 [Paramuribaculum sp.]|nr:hypothetical protein [Paramuribaculum sp.]
MKLKYLYLLILLLSIALPTVAQENTDTVDIDETVMNDTVAEVEAQKFRFIYVAADNNMSQQGLIEALTDHYNHIVHDEIPAIFYLSFRPEPIIVKFNTGDGDNPDDFESEFLYTLRQSMSYNVTPDYDRNKILEIMNENNYVTDDGFKKYENIELNFHVGKAFWDAGNNEAIIAPVFFGIDAAKHIADKKMQFNVMFRCPQSKGSFDRDVPFGTMNLDEINQIVIPRVTD